MSATRASGKSTAGVRSSEPLVKPILRLVHDADRTERTHRPSASSSSRPRKPARRAVAPATAEDLGRHRKSSRSRMLPGDAKGRRPQRGRFSRTKALVPDTSRRRRVVALSSVAALALVVFAIVAGQVMLAQASYSKSEAERELERARAEYEKARLEEAQATLPREVEQLSRGEVGLADTPEKVPLALGPSAPEPDAAPPPAPSSPERKAGGQQP